MLVISEEDELAVLEGVVLDVSVDVFELDELGGVDVSVDVFELDGLGGVELEELGSVA